MAKISSRKPRPIAIFDEKTMSLKVNKKKLKKKFDDGTPISSFEIQRFGKRLYFIRRGCDRKGNCHLWAARIRFTSDGQIIFMQGVSAQGCMGDPCDSCRFVETPGSPVLKCRCVGEGRCNHFIIAQELADFGVFLAR